MQIIGHAGIQHQSQWEALFHFASNNWFIILLLLVLSIRVVMVVRNH